MFTKLKAPGTQSHSVLIPVLTPCPQSQCVREPGGCGAPPFPSFLVVPFEVPLLSPERPSLL